MTAALALTPAPGLDSLIPLAVNTVTSPHSRRAYRAALERFFAWYGTAQPGPFCRQTVTAYRAYLEASGAGPSSINQALSAIKALAREAAACGMLNESRAAAIAGARGAKQLGVRTGNWLTLGQANALLELPDTSTLKGKRDEALIAVLLGCALRRFEAVRVVTVEHMQQRNGRWVFVDLAGKGGRIGTVPIPWWAYDAIRKWLDAAEITTGVLFRRINKAGRIEGPLGECGVWWIVKEYAACLGVQFAPHDLRRTFAKLARKGGAANDQIQYTLRHESPDTTKRYIGDCQELEHAPCDVLGIGA